MQPVDKNLQKSADFASDMWYRKLANLERLEVLHVFFRSWLILARRLMALMYKQSLDYTVVTVVVPEF